MQQKHGNKGPRLDDGAGRPTETEPTTEPPPLLPNSGLVDWPQVIEPLTPEAEELDLLNQFDQDARVQAWRRMMNAIQEAVVAGELWHPDRAYVYERATRLLREWPPDVGTPGVLRLLAGRFDSIVADADRDAAGRRPAGARSVPGIRLALRICAAVVAAQIRRDETSEELAYYASEVARLEAKVARQGAPDGGLANSKETRIPRPGALNEGCATEDELGAAGRGLAERVWSTSGGSGIDSPVPFALPQEGGWEQVRLGDDDYSFDGDDDRAEEGDAWEHAFRRYCRRNQPRTVAVVREVREYERHTPEGLPDTASPHRDGISVTVENRELALSVFVPFTGRDGPLGDPEVSRVCGACWSGGRYRHFLA